MRVVLAVVAVWSGAAVLAGGLFVALVRGGGGTDLPPLPEPPDAPVPEQAVLPGQRTAGDVESGTRARAGG